MLNMIEEISLSERYILKFNAIVLGPINDEISVKQSLVLEVNIDEN